MGNSCNFFNILLCKLYFRITAHALLLFDAKYSKGVNLIIYLCEHDTVLAIPELI